MLLSMMEYKHFYGLMVSSEEETTVFISPIIFVIAHLSQMNEARRQKMK
jgi:hypothetical protein